MTHVLFKASAGRVAAVALLAMVFGGCSADDVELNGGLFEAAGIATGSNKAKKGEPAMAARSPIVLPPNLDRLPQPGQQAGSEASDVASIDDPDKKLEVSRAQQEVAQAEYCKVHYEQALAHGDRTGAELAEGPLGPCRGSVLRAVDINVGGVAVNTQK